MNPLAIYNPSDLDSSVPPALEQFGYRFLAEGDSWFTIGALNPAKNSNLLFELAFSVSACAVNCAYPGDTLQHMVNMAKGRDFDQLLRGRKARYWDAILLSAGGNDLIDALGVSPSATDEASRLLLAPGEWGAASMGVGRYLSERGWQTFCHYFRINLKRIVSMRDQGLSAGVPIFMHGYATPTPRPAGAGLGKGPWMYPSLQAFSIPESDYVALAVEMMARLGRLLADCAADGATYPNVHVFDSTQVAIQPAGLGTRGEDGDWVNEIHLTWRGYEKIAVPWAAQIEQVLGPR